MTSLLALWLPILLSAVFVFIVSSIIHMVLPWHKNDFPKLSNQDQIMDALRPFALPPGDYMIPRADNMQQMSSSEFAEKMKRGPRLMFTVMRGDSFGMGKNLVMWFLYSALIAFCAAYVAGRALPAGANYLRVFQLIGATAFMGFSLGLWQMSIWYSRSWVITIKATIDGLIYAMVMAGTFGWLWPH